MLILTSGLRIMCSLRKTFFIQNLIIVILNFLSVLPIHNANKNSQNFLNKSSDFELELDCLNDEKISGVFCERFKPQNLFHKLEKIQLGPIQFTKLPEYAIASDWSADGIFEARNQFSNSFISRLTNNFENFLHTYAVKISLPGLTKFHSGIIVENEADPSEGRGRRKKDSKKFAMLFPIITAFKFLVVKALLVPILIGVLVIKKMLILGAMAVPALIGLLRVCRGGPFFPPAGGFLTAAGPMSAYTAGTDAIVGDFSSYSHSAQTPYNNRHEYGGRSNDHQKS